MIEARADLLEPPMNATERMYAAVAGEVPDRVPVYPKIWFDVAAKYTDTPFLQVIEDPFTALRVMMEAGLVVGADAVRQFHSPARRIEQEDGKVYEIDKTGRRLGKIDMDGGWATHLDDPKDFHQYTSDGLATSHASGQFFHPLVMSSFGFEKYHLPN